MRYKLTGIQYAPGFQLIANLPTSLITNHIDDPDPIELAREYAAGFTGWAVDGFEEIEPYPEGSDLAKLLLRHCERGTLVMDYRGWAVMVNAALVAERDDQLNSLYRQIVALLRRAPTVQIELYPDGDINALSFGVLWYHAVPKWPGSEYMERKAGINAKAFMRGGLIYRGPARGQTGKHEWSVHT